MLSREQIHKPHSFETEAKLHVNHMRKEKTPYTVQILDVPIVVHKGVFSPKFSDDTTFFIEKMVSPHGKKVLDIGTGTGAIAVLCATKGAILVHAVDINRCAVANAQENLNNQGFQAPHYKAYYSDLFDNVNEKFDIVNFNPPFTPGTPDDDLEKAELDEDYQTIKRFLGNVGSFLEPDGSVCLLWSEWGDMALLNSLIEQNGFRIQNFYEKNIPVIDYSITLFVMILKKVK